MHRLAANVINRMSNGRGLRRGLVVAVAGAGTALVGLSAAFACTVGLHGGLLIVPEEAPLEDQEIDISVYSTDNESLDPGPSWDNPYDVFIDRDAVSGTGSVTNPQECKGGDGDDEDIGDINFGTPANSLSDPKDDGYVYGEGSATVPALNDGTYEICLELEPNNHWDHFRVIEKGDGAGQ